jgi:hypothetical protein
MSKKENVVAIEITDEDDNVKRVIAKVEKLEETIIESRRILKVYKRLKLKLRLREKITRV